MVSRTGGFKALALEYMAQVPPTRGAHNLRADSPAREVVLSRHCSWDSCTQTVRSAQFVPCGLTVEERRPPAPTVELGGALVERRVAPGAGVDTLPLEVLILAGTRKLSALLPQDAELIGRLVNMCSARASVVVRTCSGDKMALHSLSLLSADSAMATRVRLK